MYRQTINSEISAHHKMNYIEERQNNQGSTKHSLM